MKKTSKPFASEAELCNAFLEEVANAGTWTAYAETQGWDILLARKADGFQIGIQAKLRLNTAVICQAIDDSRHNVDHAGPDCRAVLVPCGHSEYQRIADYVGLTIVSVDRRGWSPKTVRVNPALPERSSPWSAERWHEWMPKRRHPLPDYVPDVQAGAKSPVQLTDWKIRALKIEIIMDRQGHITRDDFRVLAIDHRRWTAPGSGWLEKIGDGRWRRGKYYPAGTARKQHPKVYAELLADEAKWRKIKAEAQLV